MAWMGYPKGVPVTNKPKQKGTQAETDVVRWAKKHDFYTAERLALRGTYDVGDVRIATGVMVQVKDGYTQRREPTDHQIDTWLHEAEKQRRNGEFEIALLVHKRYGKADPDEWRWFLDKRNALTLMGVTTMIGGTWSVWPQYIQLQGYTLPGMIRAFLKRNDPESEAA